LLAVLREPDAEIVVTPSEVSTETPKSFAVVY